MTRFTLTARRTDTRTYVFTFDADTEDEAFDLADARFHALTGKDASEIIVQQADPIR